MKTIGLGRLITDLEACRGTGSTRALVHSAMFGIGHINVEGSEYDYTDNDWQCRLLYAALSGTYTGGFAVPTFTYGYARHGIPFVYEETPSMTGKFTEWLRRFLHNNRTLHPLFSLCTSLPMIAAKFFSPYAFGQNTIWSDIECGDWDIVFAGVRLAESCTFVHHIEQQVGVPYLYNKSYDRPVYRNGKLVPGPFFAAVRYLPGVEYNHEPLEDRLRKQGLLRESGPIQAVSAQALADCIRAMLRENPFALIKEPFGVYK